MKKIASKLRSNAGESLAETLVATLIAALALVMLAGAVSAASGIITRSNTAMSTYYGNLGSDDGGWKSVVNAEID